MFLLNSLLDNTLDFVDLYLKCYSISVADALVGRKPTRDSESVGSSRKAIYAKGAAGRLPKRRCFLQVPIGGEGVVTSSNGRFPAFFYMTLPRILKPGRR
jgi:hypothetical protein